MARKSRRKMIEEKTITVEKIEYAEDTAIFQVACYVRLSDKDTVAEISNSIQNQIDLVMDFIQTRKKFCIKEIFIDDGISGLNFKRKGFQRMMKAVQDKQINCIIVKDLSRLGRNYLETGYYIEKVFPMYQIRFIAITDEIDTLTSNEFEMTYALPLKNIINQNYAIDISKKICSAKKVLRKQGKFIAPFAPYGYQKSSEDKHKLIIDKKTATIVQSIFNMAESGYSDRAIAKHLNQQGVLSPSKYRYETILAEQKSKEPNTYWCKQTIAKILTNQVYIGSIIQGITKRNPIKGKKVNIPEQEWDIVERMQEPIISEKQFYLIQNNRNKRKEQYYNKCKKEQAKKREEQQNILKGILICGNCKKSFIRKYSYNQNGYYFLCNTFEQSGMCTRNFIKESEFIEFISSYIKQIVLIWIQESKMQYKKVENESDKFQVKRMDRELKQLKEIIEKKRAEKNFFYKNWKEGSLEQQDYQQKKQEKEREILQIQQQIAKKVSKKKQWIQENTDKIQENKWVLFNLESFIISRDFLPIIVERIEVYQQDRVKIKCGFQDFFHIK